MLASKGPQRCAFVSRNEFRGFNLSRKLRKDYSFWHYANWDLRHMDNRQRRCSFASASNPIAAMLDRIMRRHLLDWRTV